MNEPSTGSGDRQPDERSAGGIPVLPDTGRDLFWDMNGPDAAFEQNVVGIGIIRADGTLAYVNRYFASLMGYSPAELVGRPFLDLVPEPERAAVVENLKVHLSGRKGFVQIEMSMHARDGGIVDVLVNASAAVFEGRPASLGVVIDISARKQMEVALRASEAKYANALKIMNAGDWEYDFLADRFTFSDNFYHLFRTTAAAVGGYTMSSAEYADRFVHPDDRSLVGDEVKAAIDTTDPNFSRAFEHRMLYADGTPGYIAVRIFIVKDKTGRTIKSYGVNQDVTKRKEVELALAASEIKLQAALTNMSQGLLMLNAEARVVLVNPSFAKIFKMPQEKITPGMSTPDLMELAFVSSGLKDIDPERTLAEQTRVLLEPAGGSYLQRLNDGRSIVAAYQPLPDGGIVATFEDITQRLLAEERIKHLAQYDALTNLPNRVTFYEQMETIVKHLRRSELVGVLSLDLDHFKAVNDTLGHPIGDLLLQAAAQRMQSCLRDGDIVARLGGDEFAILQVPARQPADITALATRLIEVVGAPYDLDRRQVIVGVSVGIAVAPGDGSEPDTLLKNADLALYRAKADGGGVYRFFEPEMDARMQARRVIELDLRKAMRNGGEFELLYQPIVNVQTGKVTSCEALVRWHHPERGLVMPAEFIPVAEATGLIVPLGEWVLQQACAEAMHWPEDITVAVNLSPAQFKSRNLVPAVVNALTTSGLPAARLELEITELVLMEESEGAFAILHQLRDLGIRIAMDDFGTGYSSLGYLRSFPFSKIKIDQSFVRDLPGKEDSVAIVRAVVGLSSSLGITTIAEGVETEGQLASLTDEGCTEFQGFLFSKPKSSVEVARILAEQVPAKETPAH